MKKGYNYEYKRTRNFVLLYMFIYLLDTTIKALSYFLSRLLKDDGEIENFDYIFVITGMTTLFQGIAVIYAKLAQDPLEGI